MSLDAKIFQSMSILERAVKDYEMTHMFGLYSSGNDSACSTHLASRCRAFTRAVTIDTTIAIPEAQEHGRRVAELFQWSMKQYRAPVAYRDIVLKHGFPGPGGHLFMYTRLKERCVEALVRDHKQRMYDRIGLVTGVRLSESSRRMGHVEPIFRRGAQLWIAPILYWNDDDKAEYMERYAIPRNPVTEKLCMSGECLCGAFAKKEEFSEIEAWFPEVAQRIRALETEAALAGVHCKWGTRPPGKRKKATMGGPLCSSCNQKNLDLP